ncbi:MAG TPA: hypothetical protein K8V91_08905 [[Clostridium] spiroforme]|uniref:Uncharacterized protein n=1 Tax=Thomasclavelia spiroformis TaxID=29348 RepID=A0A921GCM6_9FIRM|nr:hypothetical protein [Thomasclavelia spiroformis]
MINGKISHSIISTNCNKIRVEYCTDLKLQAISEKISEEQLIKINKWIFRYCRWFRIKDISSVLISNDQSSIENSIKWRFCNTKNDICVHKIIVLIINHLIKKQGGCLSSMQRNNRGYFWLTFS